MLKLALGAAVAIPAMMFTVVLGTGVMIVDVQEEDGRIIVPVPIIVAQLAAAVIPKHHIPPIEIPEAQHLSLLDFGGADSVAGGWGG